jgi:hypothetical protein
MSEKNLKGWAQDAVGSSDTIIAAAAFQPRGGELAVGGGFLGGEMVGHALGGSLGGAVGGLVGDYVGAKAIEKHEGGHVGGGATAHTITFETLVAVSATHIYAWQLHHGIHSGARAQVFALDRSAVELTVNDHMGLHTLRVEDTTTGESWGFQADHLVDHFRDLFAELHPVEV